MTREEAIDILHKMSKDNFYGNHVQEACKIGIEALSNGILLYNLNEAAEDYCNRQPGWENKMDWPEEKDKEECRRDFKAGAEWMAGQGETIGTFIEKITNDEEEFLGILVDTDTFKEGDKVIVQIRKK